MGPCGCLPFRSPLDQGENSVLLKNLTLYVEFKGQRVQGIRIFEATGLPVLADVALRLERGLGDG